MTLSWVPRITIEQNVLVTPTVTANSAYVSGYQVGGVMTLPNVLRQDSSTALGTAMLTSVSVIDKAAQSAAFNLWFFKTSPTIASSDHAAFNITDANLLAAFIGTVAIGGTYTASSSNSVSSDCNLNLPVSATSGTSIYVVATTTSTPTYTSTSDLTFLFNFLVD